jgi:hypothetical protein
LTITTAHDQRRICFVAAGRTRGIECASGPEPDWRAVRSGDAKVNLEFEHFIGALFD